MPIIYPFISICDSNKYIETIVNPLFFKKHHMPDVRRAYDAYEAYEVYAMMASIIV